MITLICYNLFLYAIRLKKMGDKAGNTYPSTKNFVPECQKTFKNV